MSMVHDSIVKSYEVNFDNDTLNIRTEYFSDTVHDEVVYEATCIVFSGYLAHSFYCAMKDSVISDLEETSVHDFLKREHERLDLCKPFGWPICYEDFDDHIGELCDYLLQNSYRIFYLNAVIGLNGWIIAKEVDLVTKSLA